MVHQKGCRELFALKLRVNFPVAFVKQTRRQFAGLSHCGEPNDTRFRSAARLRQSLWREENGYACGRYIHPDGRSCRLGSMVSARVGQRGVNLIDTSLIPLVQREIAYREVGAVIQTDRLWNNLLTSQALTFNLFGPLKLRPRLQLRSCAGWCPIWLAK